MNQRELLINAGKKHAEGHIDKHAANVEIYLNHSVGIGEHSDIIEAIEQELDEIAKYHDQIEVLDRYINNG